MNITYKAFRTVCAQAHCETSFLLGLMCCSVVRGLSNPRVSSLIRLFGLGLSAVLLPCPASPLQSLPRAATVILKGIEIGVIGRDGSKVLKGDVVEGGAATVLVQESRIEVGKVCVTPARFLLPPWTLLTNDAVIPHLIPLTLKPHLLLG